ncbi:MAG: SpoIIE family protein phosphatase [Bacteroidales bacterium]|nr:SpoIIE family protein phosphatase [Bacteroidales bacterium]
MQKLLEKIKVSGTNPLFSEELNRVISLTNYFVFLYVFLTIPFVLFFLSSPIAAAISFVPIVIHFFSFFLIKFKKHTVGRLLFSSTSSIATYIIAILLYNDNLTDGMGAKFLIFGSIILPFVIFISKEWIYSLLVIILQLFLIFSFGYINSIVDIQIVSQNFDTAVFRIIAVSVAFIMIGGTFFYYQNELSKKNKLLKETNSQIKEKNDELIASEEELRQNNEELLTLNEHVEFQKNKIEKSHKSITNSINYAKRIQYAMMPTHEIFKKYFSDFFILFKPRDIVSGDFYWAEEINGKIIHAVADCTGHGVPGAMVSMLGIALLNKITTLEKNICASDILNKLRFELKKSLKQSGQNDENKDGMDIALVVIDTNSMELQFSGAYNSLYLIRNNQIIKFNADKQPIAIHLREKEFTNHTFSLQKDDYLYCFSDGLPDQLNNQRTKFGKKNLLSILQKISPKKMEEQKQILLTELSDWQVDAKQTDDIVMVGLKI